MQTTYYDYVVWCETEKKTGSEEMSIKTKTNYTNIIVVSPVNDIQTTVFLKKCWNFTELIRC